LSSGRRANTTNRFDTAMCVAQRCRGLRLRSLLQIDRVSNTTADETLFAADGDTATHATSTTRHRNRHTRHTRDTHEKQEEKPNKTEHETHSKLKKSKANATENHCQSKRGSKLRHSNHRSKRSMRKGIGVLEGKRPDRSESGATNRQINLVSEKSRYETLL